jgi:hypothetical protein
MVKRYTKILVTENGKINEIKEVEKFQIILDHERKLDIIFNEEMDEILVTSSFIGEKRGKYTFLELIPSACNMFHVKVKTSEGTPDQLVKL